MIIPIPEDSVANCRRLAAQIAQDVQKDISSMSTVSIERSLLRLMGIEGVDEEKVPLVNRVVDAVFRSRGLEEGVLYWIGNALCEMGFPLQEICQRVADDSLDLFHLPRHDFSQIQSQVEAVALDSLSHLFHKRAERRLFQQGFSPTLPPLLYVIVATGNIYDDIAQARAAGEQGADVIAVIRSTAQSLLDYVPEGITTEGFGGTFATQANFRLMREALDEVSEKNSRYIRQVNYCSGLCMAEIATLGIKEGLDILVNDAIYGVLFRDLNMVRIMIDQSFSRFLLGLFDLVIVTGEDNLIKTVDAFQNYHIVLVSQFINEQLAKQAGMKESQIGLGHAAELDPSLEDSLLWELAQAQLIRQLFPSSPIKFMPPTSHKSGNIFFAHALDTLFNLVSVWTEQEIVLLGMPTEATHTPYVQDRFLSLESALHVRRAARHFSWELQFKKDGAVQKRALEVISKAEKTLEQVVQEGLWTALAKGYFSQIRRERRGGRGHEGVFRKGEFYLNPFLKPELIEIARQKRR